MTTYFELSAASLAATVEVGISPGLGSDPLYDGVGHLTNGDSIVFAFGAPAYGGQQDHSEADPSQSGYASRNSRTHRDSFGLAIRYCKV